MGIITWWRKSAEKAKEEWKNNWKLVFARSYLAYTFQIQPEDGGNNVPVPTADTITSEQLAHLDKVIPETFEALIYGLAVMFRWKEMRSYTKAERTEIIIEMMHTIRHAEHKGATLMAITVLGVSAPNEAQEG